MELVHSIFSKRPSVSDPINVSEFKKKWSDTLKSTNVQLFSSIFNEGLKAQQLNIAGKLNFSPLSTEFKTLEADCSESRLACDGVEIEILNAKSVRRTLHHNFPDENDDQTEELSTIRFQKEALKKRNQEKGYRIPLRYQWRQSLCNEQSSILPDVSREVNETEMLNNNIDSNEVVLFVQVFQPFPSKKTKDISQALDQVFQVLACQKLSELKDAITCCSDNTVPGDYSEDPSSIPNFTAKDRCKSGFFYIGGTFYNDLRYPNNDDYSSDIISWATQKSDQSVGPFSSESMAHVRFRDLKIQFGYPYYYLHQGDCEHIIVFSDMRLLNPEEKQDLSHYPLPCRENRRRRITCMICSTHRAKWVTHGNKRLSEEYYFFCDTCFHSFNYTKEGKKIGQFRAYVYINPTNL